MRRKFKNCKDMVKQNGCWQLCFEKLMQLVSVGHTRQRCVSTTRQSFQIARRTRACAEVSSDKRAIQQSMQMWRGNCNSN